MVRGTETSAIGDAAGRRARGRARRSAGGEGPVPDGTPIGRGERRKGGRRPRRRPKPRPAHLGRVATVRRSPLPLRLTRVVFVDVGQGDATVITSGSWTGLVDGGPPGSEAAVEAALRRLGVRRLSAVVVSHMHADHTGGLPRIVRCRRPRPAYMAGRPTAPGAAPFAAPARWWSRSGAEPACGSVRQRAQVLSPGGLSADAERRQSRARLDAGGGELPLHRRLHRAQRGRGGEHLRPRPVPSTCSRSRITAPATPRPRPSSRRRVRESP